MIAINEISIADLTGLPKGGVLLRIDWHYSGDFIVGCIEGTDVAISLSGDNQFSVRPLNSCGGVIGLSAEGVELHVDPNSGTAMSPLVGSLGIAGKRTSICVREPGGWQGSMMDVDLNGGDVADNDRPVRFSKWSIVKRQADGSILPLFNFDVTPKDEVAAP